MAEETITLKLVAQDLASGNISKAIAGLDKLAMRGGLVGSMAQGVGQAFGQMVNPFTMATKAIGIVTDTISDGIAAASDLVESQNKVDAVFTTSARTIHEWASSSARDFGLSSAAALEAAGTFGNFVQALGNTEDEANKMSRSLVELSADLASFNNMEINDVLTSLRSGLTGEAEPMRRLGVSISAARVEANILAKGIASTKAEITDAMKVSERYAIIMQDTAKAQGDFARNADELSNSQRTLAAQQANLNAKIGQAFIGPAKLATQALTAFADVVLMLVGEGEPGHMERFRKELGLTNEALKESARTVAMAESEWAGSGTIFDSAIDGLFALQGAAEDLGLAPGIKQMREFRDALRPMAQALGADEGEIAAFAKEAIEAGKSLDETTAAMRRLWESATSGEQERARNLFAGMKASWGDVATGAKSAATDVAEATERIVGTVADLPASLRDTIRDGKSRVREAMTELRWALEHPFAGDKYEKFLERKQRNAQRLLQRALREGKTEAARDAAALVSAIQGELEALENRTFTVNVGVEYDPVTARLRGEGMRLRRQEMEGGGKKGKKGRQGHAGIAHVPEDDWYFLQRGETVSSGQESRQQENRSGPVVQVFVGYAHDARALARDAGPEIARWMRAQGLVPG